MKNIIESFKYNAINNPDKLFCMDDNNSYTYKESYKIVK